MSAPRLLGVELYFDDLDAAKRFYRNTLDLELVEENTGHFAQFTCGPAFVCLERKGSESYPSQDKAVLFIEVDDLAATVVRLGPDRILQLHTDAASQKPAWVVLHDSEGHNVLLLQAGRQTTA